MAGPAVSNTEAVACQVNAGGIGAGNGFSQGGQVAVNGHFQLLAAGGGVGCLCQQLDRVEQAGLVFRLNSQHGQAHFLHLGDGILELGGHDDKIRGQRSAASRSNSLAVPMLGRDWISGADRL